MEAAQTVSKANIAETLGIALGAARTVSTANIAETLGAAPVMNSSQIQMEHNLGLQFTSLAIPSLFMWS